VGAVRTDRGHAGRALKTVHVGGRLASDIAGPPRSWPQLPDEVSARARGGWRAAQERSRERDLHAL